MKRFAIPLTVVVVGIAWLLTAHGVLPAVSWAWTLGLALAGLFSFVYLGFNTVTVVLGPFLLIASIFSVLRQTGTIPLSTELPLLFIVLGLLMFLPQLFPVPKPSWLLEEDSGVEKQKLDR